MLNPLTDLGPFPAPTNHIIDDPTPKDQAVYIPSVTPSYAIAAHAQNWTRHLPNGVHPADLNFLDPANKLFRISHVMSSAGQALLQKKPCIIRERDRSSTMMIADSGGYQIAKGTLKIFGDHDRLEILRWQEQHADWAMTLDVPTGPLLSKDKDKYKYKTFNDCLKETLYNLDFWQRNRDSDRVKFLNVLQGNDTKQANQWYEAVKGFPFEGWAFAGKLRHNFYNLCARIIKMADDNVIQDRNWIHILGTNELDVAVGLTALQRSINKHINPNLRISLDTSTAFRMLSFAGVYSFPKFDKSGMVMPTVRIPDARKYVGSTIRFPWPSPLGDKLSMGDVCCVPGTNLKTYRDNQSNCYLAHHNLAALCFAINFANRVFDSESIEAKHNISADMGRVVAAIDEVIKSGSMQTLDRRRSIFDAVRKVETVEDVDLHRDFLDI